MTLHVRSHYFGEWFIASRKVFEDQQEGNHSVIGKEIFAEIVMRAHLSREDRVFFSHSILDERVAALGNDWLGAMLFTHFNRRPNHPGIKNDFVVTAVFCQQDVGKHRGYVCTGNKVALLIKEH